MTGTEIKPYRPEGYRTGRPPKYSPDLLRDCWDYIYGNDDVVDDNGNPIPKWMHLGHPFPSVVGLCVYIGIVSSTAYKWRYEDDKQEFSSILDIVEDIQHIQLAHNGTLGIYNPTITKLMLTKHGYSDKIDTDLSNTDGSMQNTSLDLSKLTTEQLAALREAMNPDAFESS